MIKLTVILSVVAATATARKNLHEKKLAAIPRKLWHKGDQKPSPPDPETCYTKGAFFYTDESNCWQDWDEYCLPNWDSDEECLQVTLDFVDSLSADSDGGGSGGITCFGVVFPPSESCWYEEAHEYQDGSVCEDSWMKWHRDCFWGCAEQGICEKLEARY